MGAGNYLPQCDMDCEDLELGFYLDNDVFGKFDEGNPEDFYHNHEMVIDDIAESLINEFSDFVKEERKYFGRFTRCVASYNGLPIHYVIAENNWSTAFYIVCSDPEELEELDGRKTFEQVIAWFNTYMRNTYAPLGLLHKRAGAWTSEKIRWGESNKPQVGDRYADEKGEPYYVTDVHGQEVSLVGKKGSLVVSYPRLAYKYFLMKKAV